MTSLQLYFLTGGYYMQGQLDVDIEVSCSECGCELTVKDVSNYKSAELCIEVEPCHNCLGRR